MRADKGLRAVTGSNMSERELTRSAFRAAAAKSAEATPESHVPRRGEQELTPYSRFARAGCRGVTGLVPQPLCMKLRLALEGKLECSGFITVPVLAQEGLQRTVRSRV